MKKVFFPLFLLLPLISCTDFKRNNPCDRNNIDYSAPKIISIGKGTDEAVNVKWSVKQDDIKEFIIYRGAGPDNLAEIARVGKEHTSFTDAYKGLEESPYYYTVKAVLIAGETSKQSNIEEGFSSKAVIHFADKKLEKAVQKALNKKIGEKIFVCDAAGLTTLSDLTGGINNLRGIEHLSALESLNLMGHSLQDISPLAQLSKLKFLRLHDSNLENISCLAELSQLEVLDLSNNSITEISALSSLTKLTKLDIYRNMIKDISPLFSLKNLRDLDISNNKINSISVLSGLEELKHFTIMDTNIPDLNPLINNPGFGAGDTIVISQPPSSNLYRPGIQGQLLHLKKKGVTIHEKKL